MAFVDEITVHMRAGRGGNGVVRWRHEKGKEWAGAAGGNGGKGGDVYARGVRDFGVLATYRNKKEFLAENGQNGMKKSMYGRDGDDFYLDVPVGSIVTNLSNGDKHELLKEGEAALLLKGGRGGLGNEHFKASTNTTPWEHTDGKEGEEADFSIELQLIVDAGFVGLPNAGKSSLLNALTNAHAKVGNYQFTTLEPNLGDFYGYILADIPGLIEGASQGKGLGHKFLRHIKRTRIILHCISLESPDAIADAYKTIRKELEAYDTELAKKPETIILTKTDLVDGKTLKACIKAVEKMTGGDGQILTVSVYDDASVKALADSLSDILKNVR